MKHAVILFTRLPVAGRTKTRLMPVCTGEQCAALHKAMLLDTVHVLRTLNKDLFIFHTPGEGGEERQLQHLLGPAAYLAQKGGDLGQRMHNAYAAIFSRGYATCLLLGADIPLLEREDFHRADRLLADYDTVLCPTKDGGYWMAGLKEPFPGLFLDKRYGHGSVLEQAEAACADAGRTLVLGGEKMDVDTPEDLNRLRELLGRRELPPGPSCAHMRALLQIETPGSH